MEASALSHASRRGLLARRSPVLKLEGDERLVALIRAGNDRAFEVLFDRYQSRLLAFCSSMLKSRQDAEDVLQEVFVNAHAAMLGDDRKINVRPWLYRIARNRCLNHLRRPVHEGQDSMDIHPHMNGATTEGRVQDREELRQVLNDVGTLPETQRTALLLREIDQMSYDEIAVAMETTIPAVKSLLVRARITLAESSEARTLSCDEVRVTLAEAAEGLSKAGGPVRIHVRNCESCAGFRKQLRSDHRALAAILPLGPLAVIKASFIGKILGGGSAAAGSGSAGAAGAIGGSAAGGGAGLGGVGAIGTAIGAKAIAGVATAALLTAGAVEVRHITRDRTEPEPRTAQAPISDTPVPTRALADERAASFSGNLAVAAAGAGAATPVKASDASTHDRGGHPGEGQTPPVATVPISNPVVTDPAVTDVVDDTATDPAVDGGGTAVVVEDPTAIDDAGSGSTTDGGTTTPGNPPDTAPPPPPPSTPPVTDGNIAVPIAPSTPAPNASGPSPTS